MAAEDQEIVNDVKKNGGKAILTSNKHKTGTDRIFEAYQKLNLVNIDFIMNLQGDEPAINIRDIVNLNQLMINHKAKIGTLAAKIENKLDLDIDYLWAGSTGGGSSLNMIFHNGVDDNEISKVENMLNDMVPLDTIADELNYSFETEEYHQTPIKVEE